MVSLWKEYLASAQLDGRRASVDTTDPRAALAESNNTPSPDASAVCR